MEMQSRPLLRVEQNGVLFMTVRIAETPDGLAWFDTPVLFCPFCGSHLQSKDSIARAPCITVPSNEEL